MGNPQVSQVGSRLVLEVSGMTCGGCVNALRNALARSGLDVADVSVGAATLAVPSGEEAAVEARAREAIARAGFTTDSVRSA